MFLKPISEAAGFKTFWIRALILLGTLAPYALHAQVLDSFNPNASSFINALAVQPDGKILTGGDFLKMSGQSRSCFARINSDGTLDPSLIPDPDGLVYSLAVQSDGKILVVGNFYHIGGQLHVRIARLNADSSIDSNFKPEADKNVYSLAVQPDGKIIVGGEFVTLNGQPRNHIGRLNADGTLDESFNPGADNIVYPVVLQDDGKILVAGAFTNLAGRARSYIGRLNSDGSLDTNFNASLSSTPVSIAVQTNGQILIGGGFTTMNGQPRARIGRLNPDGTLDETFNPGTSNVVRAITLQANGKIIVGGEFTSLAGTARNYIGRLNSDGTLDATFTLGANGAVYGLALQPDGKIVLGGTFTSLGGQTRNRLGRLINNDPAEDALSFDGSSITWLRGGSSPEVWRTTFAVSTNGDGWTDLGPGQRIAGGWKLEGIEFPIGSSIRAQGFALSGRYNGSAWFVEKTIGPPVISMHPVSRTNNAGTVATFNVSALGELPLSYQWTKDGVALLTNSNILATTNFTLTISNVLGGDAGSYSLIITNAFGSLTSMVATLQVIDPLIKVHPVDRYIRPGQTANFAVSAIGTELNYQWRKDGTNLPGATTTSLTLTNSQRMDAGAYSVLVSNSFGAVISSNAVLTVDLSSLDTFDPFSGGRIISIVPQRDGKILVGGNFGAIGNKTRRCIARLDTNGVPDEAFAGLDVSGSLYCLVLQTDEKIMTANSFLPVGGALHRYINRFNPDGTLDTAFNPEPDAGISSMFLSSEENIIMSGNFNVLAGQPRIRIGALHQDGTLSSNFSLTFNTSVAPMHEQADHKILVSGSFTNLLGQPRSYLGRLNADGTLDLGFNPGANSNVYSFALQADGKILVGGAFTNLAGQPRSYLGRLNADGTLDSSFNPGASSNVNSLCLQADGKILVGGAFTNLGGLSRNFIARLNSDGTVDTTFNPGANFAVYPIVLQPDGKIIVAGDFNRLIGQERNFMGRLNNTDPATQNLTFDGSNIIWQRGGSAPEVSRTSFEVSTNGMDWTSLGAGTRIPGGWSLEGVSLPPDSIIRARGFVSNSSRLGSSCWFLESTLQTQPPTPLSILVNDGHFGFNSNKFGFTINGGAGQTIVVETSTNLLNWTALLTNSIGTGSLYFNDSREISPATQFYRARVQ